MDLIGVVGKPVSTSEKCDSVQSGQASQADVLSLLVACILRHKFVDVLQPDISIYSSRWDTDTCRYRWWQWCNSKIWQTSSNGHYEFLYIYFYIFIRQHHAITIHICESANIRIRPTKLSLVPAVSNNFRPTDSLDCLTRGAIWKSKIHFSIRFPVRIPFTANIALPTKHVMWHQVRVVLRAVV